MFSLNMAGGGPRLPEPSHQVLLRLRPIRSRSAAAACLGPRLQPQPQLRGHSDRPQRDPPDDGGAATRPCRSPFPRIPVRSFSCSCSTLLLTDFCRSVVRFPIQKMVGGLAFPALPRITSSARTWPALGDTLDSLVPLLPSAPDQPSADACSHPSGRSSCRATRRCPRRSKAPKFPTVIAFSFLVDESKL